MAENANVVNIEVIRISLTKFVRQYQSFQTLCMGGRAANEANIAEAYAECDKLCDELVYINKAINLYLEAYPHDSENRHLKETNADILEMLGKLQHLSSSGSLSLMGTAKGTENIGTQLSSINTRLGYLTAREGINY